jgi:hypothetical protein
MSRDMDMLDRLATALVEFRAKNGVFPTGTRVEIAKALSSTTNGVGYSPDQISSTGEIIDYRRVPVLILCSNHDWSIVATVNVREQTLREYVIIPPKKAGAKRVGL